MKNLKKFLLILFVVPCLFILNACSFIENKQIYVTNIVQGETIDGKTTYTVFYSNGKTSLFSVNDGKDGENGNALTIESIKQYCENNDIDFESFLKEYLTIVQENKTVKYATNIAIQSAVTIWCEFPFGDYYTKENKMACGAGVIYKIEEDVSYILTNYHVVYYYGCKTEDYFAQKITLFQYGTSEEVYKTDQVDENGYPQYIYGYGAVDAEYIGGSMKYDLALLKVNTADLLEFNPNAKAVTISSNGYALGETAIAIGNPECGGFSVTSGIISVESEEITMKGADDIHTFDFRVMRIDTAINGGNSGGGLFNINGELIGIVNARAVSSDIDNIAFALPLDNVLAVAENILYYYSQNPSTHAKVKTLNLGLTYYADNNRAIYNPTTNEITLIEDVIVETLSIGFASNLQFHVGDIIKTISINGIEHEITRAHQIEDLMLTIRADDKVIITVKNNGSLQELGSSTLGVAQKYFTAVI